MSHKILFLDVDGVLNNHRKQSNGYCGINKECVDNLNLVLNAIPDLNIIMSSAWRYMIPKSMTTVGFEYMLLISGLNCAGRVIGCTRLDDVNNENDSRGLQIKDWLEARNNVDIKYVIVDDMPMDFKEQGLNHVITNHTVGLSTADAHEIIRRFS